MTSTRISIITVTYNAAKTLQSCFDSIKRQNVHGIEHILVDGLSTDQTLNIIRSNRSSISHFVSEPDLGIYDAMNKGIKAANGDIIGILNADDQYHSSSTLLKVIKVFDNVSTDACYGDLNYVKENNSKRRFKVVRHWKAGTYKTEKFFWGWMPPHPTFFVKRDVYDEYGLFNIDIGSAADYEIMLRFLLKYRIKATYIPEVLVDMRIGGVSNASLLNRLKANSGDRKAWKANGVSPYPWTLLMKPLRKIPQFFY